LDGNGNRVRDADIEEEAAFLGGTLLITNEAAHHIIRSGMGALALNVYSVSREMLTYRLRMSGAKITADRRAKRWSPGS
jgi:hypothetical protein